jgi:alpha-L-fucosidase 2
MDILTRRLSWPFPLEVTHDAIPLGNGLLGTLLWGGGKELRITINRSDYWDHRAGKELNDRTTFQNTLRLLKAGDQEGLNKLFEYTYREDCHWAPTRLPMGRFDLVLEEDSFQSGGLHLSRGEAQIDVSKGSVHAVVIRKNPVLSMNAPENLAFRIHPHPPDAEDIKKFFAKCGYPAPKIFQEDQFSGWVQPRPDGEPVMCAACLRAGRDIFLTSVYGRDEEEAIHAARKILEESAVLGFQNLRRQTREWWEKYWAKTPRIQIPDGDLKLLYTLGMYKLAGMAAPDSPPAGLQGPWVEDDRVTPWQGDFHFNINVQECYWPAYAGNHPEWLRPLFEMLWSWLPVLRENAKKFLGIDDGIMLFMATDDRGQREYADWLALVDSGSTAWMAQMMWQYYQYTLDEPFLRDRAYPFMKGAMRVYEAMLEDDGTHYHLPMGVSPEFYFGARWGRDASFQLANIHALCRGLLAAAATLKIDEKDRTRWADIAGRLPRASTADVGHGEEILIWDNQPLDQSHRHHSHLAGIFPFDIFDYGPDGPHKTLIENSMHRLTRMGMGTWSGWCLPWASILWSRMGRGQMARFCLEIFRQFFVRPGFATTHDAIFPGLTIYDDRRDLMQLDGAMGAATAVMEMLLHTQNGTLYIFPAPAPDWSDIAFKNIRAEGAFLVDAVREKGKTVRVEIRSEAGQALKIANPFAPHNGIVKRENKPVENWSGLLEIPTIKGESITLIPA